MTSSLARGRDLSESKIENFGLAALGDEDIRRFDVPVDDPAGVRAGECIRDFDAQLENLIDLHRAAADLVDVYKRQAEHASALGRAPGEYENRVIGFFTEAFANRAAQPSKASQFR